MCNKPEWVLEGETEVKATIREIMAFLESLDFEVKLFDDMTFEATHHQIIGEDGEPSVLHVDFALLPSNDDIMLVNRRNRYTMARKEISLNDLFDFFG